MMLVARLRQALPGGELGRGVLTLVAGTGTAQVVVIACSPVLTRLYSPSEYGIYSVATSMLGVLITITCLRYEAAIPLPEADVAAANVLALALVAALATSLITAGVLWVIGPPLLAVFGASVLAPYVLLLPLGQLGGGIVSGFTNWAVRTKTFSAIATMRLTQSISLVATQVGLGVLGIGAPGLLVGDVVGRAAGSGRLARAAWRTHALAFRRITRAGIRQAAGRYRRFPIFSSWSAFLSALAMQAPLLLLVALYGTQAGGRYALADRVGSVPLALVAGAVGQVFIAESARLARDQPAALASLFGRTTRSLARTAIAPAALLAVAAPLLAGPVFGADWADAGLFVAILAPMYYLTFVMSATGEILYVLERQDLHLAREVLRLGFLGGAIPLAAAIDLSPIGAVGLLSAAGCVAYLLYGLISWRAVRAFEGRPPEATAAGPGVAGAAGGPGVAGGTGDRDADE